MAKLPGTSRRPPGLVRMGSVKVLDESRLREQDTQEHFSGSYPSQSMETATTAVHVQEPANSLGRMIIHHRVMTGFNWET